MFENKRICLFNMRRLNIASKTRIHTHNECPFSPFYHFSHKLNKQKPTNHTYVWHIAYQIKINKLSGNFFYRPPPCIQCVYLMAKKLIHIVRMRAFFTLNIFHIYMYILHLVAPFFFTLHFRFERKKKDFFHIIYADNLTC